MRIVRSAVISDVGRVRTNNEDAAMAQGNLLAVCDGMGGHAAGEVASALAIETLTEHAASIDTLAQEGSSAAADHRQAVGEALERAIQAANAAVLQAAARNQTPGMGTTLVAATVVGPHAVIAHVGDSRAWLWRGGSVYQLTEDHTVSMLRFKRGHITAEQLATDPHRNHLYRAVGLADYVDVDLADVALADGDVLMLCSDGLHGVVSEPRIAEILGIPDPTDAARALIRAANDGGGPDNVTVAIAQISGEIASDRLTSRQALLRRLYLFTELTDSELAVVAHYLDEAGAPAGAVLAKEGQPGDDFMILLDGRVRVSAGDVKLVDLGAGGSFGELSLVSPAPRSATVVVIEPCTMLVLSRANYEELSARRPQVGIKIAAAMLRSMADRVRDLTGRIAAVERAIRGPARG